MFKSWDVKVSGDNLTDLLYPDHPCWDRAISPTKTKDKDGNDCFKVDVPGYNKHNLSINRRGKIIVIEGKDKDDDLSMKVTLTSNPESIKASVKDGILTLTLGKDREDEHIAIE